MKFIIAIIIAYLLGAIPSGFILGKILKKIDIRNYGSKNIGATNVFRVIGVIPGIISLIFDFLKGFFAVQIGRCILESPTNIFNISILNVFNNIKGTQTFQILIIIVGISVVLGHIFPIFLKFKGGKGVATGAGAFINIIPVPVIYALIPFVIILIIFRYVSLASMIAVITFFGTELIKNIPNFDELPFLILTAFIMILIIFRHKENIKRLMNGKEKKLW
ncbi:MAG: glycerol-3-phosphate 1-O-acyltransferase PlsY [Candidatus Cloacimonetes bacterium]|nr:glycerol-3-phosphate 1-O-acyltransferase PlsY [Candidatus Cloacimonadota bacterium]MBL7085566.1 glycerol-3-phosphate 1-O-acyltransferase PlsY [Candidatus Cloacimonadota bacterium]